MFPEMKNDPAGMISLPRACLIPVHAGKTAASLLRHALQQNSPPQRIAAFYTALAVLWKTGPNPVPLLFADRNSSNPRQKRKYITLMKQTKPIHSH